MKRKIAKKIKKILAIGMTLAMTVFAVNIPAAKTFAAGTVQIPYGGLTDYNYSDIDYNYAKLLQYSLYLYDGNMCGTDVGENSLFDWRDDCHTFDKTTYTRKDGVTVNVDVTGGFHDAGDAVKFGLPEAYAAYVLGMSYDTNKSAYEAAGQVGHLNTITTHFADYLKNCAVLDANGNVETYVVQVGMGGGGFDHGYWGAPEAQTNANRQIYFSSSSDPSTDIVCLSAAALAMQYKNFGGNEYLETARKLFDYARNNPKGTGRTAGSFYASSAWQDDYCLAAIMLYQVTGESGYLSEYNAYASDGNAVKGYWPLCWDNVGPAVAYYAGRSDVLSTVMGIGNGNSNYGGYRCVDDWGSARYNTSMQYTGLMYDKMTNTSTYRSWAEGQMKYLLGNNAAKQCYVVGYNAYSPKYPHHRAASGYSGSVQGTKQQAHVLTGALVGGQSLNGSYTDTADNYQCNEVAIDYNATLTASAAALYDLHINETATQYVDPSYYVDGSASIPLASRGIYVSENSTDTIVAGMCTNYKDDSNVEYRWIACRSENDQNWFEIKGWTLGDEWLVWNPESSGNYVIVCEARIAGDDSTKVSADVGVEHHKYIKGKCQMPNPYGTGFLIGFETYDNPNQEYRYEMQILDCTLLREGLPAWTYTTGQCLVPETSFWTTWDPLYGYYWTLFRLYDADGNLIDEACYGFQNI